MDYSFSTHYSIFNLGTLSSEEDSSYIDSDDESIESENYDTKSNV